MIQSIKDAFAIKSIEKIAEALGIEKVRLESWHSKDSTMKYIRDYELRALREVFGKLPEVQAFINALNLEKGVKNYELLLREEEARTMITIKALLGKFRANMAVLEATPAAIPEDIYELIEEIAQRLYRLTKNTK